MHAAVAIEKVASGGGGAAAALLLRTTGFFAFSFLTVLVLECICAAIVMLRFHSIFLFVISIRDGYLELHVSRIGYDGPPSPFVPNQDAAFVCKYIGNDLFRCRRNAHALFVVVLDQAVKFDVSRVSLDQFARSKEDVVGSGAFDYAIRRLSFWIFEGASDFQPHS